MNLAPLLRTHIGQDFATTLLGLESHAVRAYFKRAASVFLNALQFPSAGPTQKSRSASLANWVFRLAGQVPNSLLNLCNPC